MAEFPINSFQMADRPDAPVRETQVNIEVNNLLKNISLLEGDINELVGRLEPILRINPRVLKEKENDVEFVQLARTLHGYNMRLLAMLETVTYAIGSLEL